jgi:hypothetical protein
LAHDYDDESLFLQRSSIIIAMLSFALGKKRRVTRGLHSTEELLPLFFADGIRGAPQ